MARDRLRLIDPADLAPTDSVRPEGGALVELHAHSSNRSRDSGVKVHDLAEQAKARGLDALCLTEHNTLWPQHEIDELNERHEFTLIRGMELGTDVGHVIVLGLDRYHPELLEIEVLWRAVRDEGAVAVLAHPMRYRPGRQASWYEMQEWFHGLEVINGDHSDTVNGHYHSIAAGLELSAVAGSDAHSLQAVGRVATAVPGPVNGVDDLVGFIASQQAWPVDMRPGRALDSRHE